MLHQRAPIAVMDHLRNKIETNDSILFLTPCHSTPYYSYLHKNINMTFLTCEPNLENLKNYKDEADKFFEKPIEWINNHETKITQKTTYIVLFENLYNELKNSTDKITNNIISKRFYVSNKFFYSLTKQTQTTDKMLLLLELNIRKANNEESNEKIEI
jgi:hypothetical protein